MTTHSEFRDAIRGDFSPEVVLLVGDISTMDVRGYRWVLNPANHLLVHGRGFVAAAW